jgi:CRISPR-associated endonuclease Cas2
MYVVVVYDADPTERAGIRTFLMPHLHWIQNSVFAGELTQTAALDLYEALRSFAKLARITFWLFDRRPETWHIGTQDDEETIFL